MGKTFSASAVVDGVVYAIGPGGVERLTGDATRWERVYEGDAFPVSHTSAGAVDSLIYVIGGYPAERGRAVAFDTRTNRVVEVPDIPGAKPGDHFRIVAVLMNELHVIGGYDGERFVPLNQHWVLRGSEWSESTRTPEPVWAKFSVHATVGDRLYIFSEGPSLCYHASTNTWHAVEPCPARLLVMPGSIVLGTKIVVIGGVLSDGTPNGVLVYDCESNSWSGPGVLLE
ncbi:MAG: hypothetical protein IPK69_07145 [Phycisphaerales bacterium]|nr:MAG: hypothetical protein IPK69_07145 [Phycisphaerales bacterium]